MTLCACTHDESRHYPGGPCAVRLPADQAAELADERCPCRRFIGSTVASLLLRSVRASTVPAVQNCTAAAAPLAAEQDVYDGMAVPVPRLLLYQRPGDVVRWLRRTRP